jgi:hypothetical protein
MFPYGIIMLSNLINKVKYMRALSTISILLLICNMITWASMPCCTARAAKKQQESAHSCCQKEKETKKESTHHCDSKSECIICNSESNQSERNISIISSFPLITSHSNHPVDICYLNFSPKCSPVKANSLKIPGDSFSSLYPLRI